MRFIFFLLFSFPLFGIEVLSIGDIVIDYIVFVDEDFLQQVPGEKGGAQDVDAQTFAKLIQNNPIKRTGGSAVNMLKGLGILGHECAVLGIIGNDAEKDYFLDILRQHHVSPIFCKMDAPTGRVVCLVTPDGQRTMRTYFSTLDSPFDFTIDSNVFKGIKHFHIEAYQLPKMDLLKKAISYARAEKAVMSMDLSCFELVKEFRKEILEILEKDVDLIFANEDEAQALISLEPKEACQKLSKICKIAVVTTGPDGGFVASCGRCFHFPAFSAQTIDETGAGDLFVSGFLHGYLMGASLEDCAWLGAQIAARIVQVIGAEMPQEKWQELLPLLKNRTLANR